MRWISFAAVFSLLIIFPAGSASAQTAQTSATPVAVVNGQRITEADLRQAAADKYQALEREYQHNLHELTEDVLQQVIAERLLDAEARARGVSREQLLAEISPAPVSDADVDKFYEENKAQIPRPKEQVAAQIKTYLQQQGQQTARQTYFKALEKKYNVEVMLEPFRIDVAATGVSQGPTAAPVTIIEFADFQCPFSSRLAPTLKQVRQQYGDKVRLVFRQFPLAIHANAEKAAEATLCAADQGRFWEMHDALFANQSALGVDQLKARAAALGLNAQAFNACLDSGSKATTISADVKAGTAAGVNGTPTLFINGRFISGTVPVEQITSAIDDELRRRSKSH